MKCLVWAAKHAGVVCCFCLLGHPVRSAARTEEPSCGHAIRVVRETTG